MRQGYLAEAVQHFREALKSGNAEQAEQAFRLTASALDKAIQKGIIHENTASRYKSRLGIRVKKLASE